MTIGRVDTHYAPLPRRIRDDGRALVLRRAQAHSRLERNANAVVLLPVFITDIVAPTGLEVGATTHPLRDDRLELGRSFLPDAVAGLEDVQACMRQSFAQERPVSSEPVGVVPTDHDCHGYLDGREAGRQCCQVFRVRANERRRPRQPITLVRREIVVADEGWHSVPANRSQESAYDLDGI